MQKTKAIINGSTKKLSIRSNPWNPNDETPIGFLEKEESFIVDLNDIVYDWKGNMFYAYVKFGKRAGYIRADACDMIE